MFDDATLRSKIGYAAYHMSEFRARFMNYDNNGARDLFLANGHVLENSRSSTPTCTMLSAS